MASKSAFAERQIHVRELAEVFNTSPQFMSRHLGVDQDDIVPLEPVSDVLECRPELLHGLLSKRDLALSAESAAKLLGVTGMTIRNNYEPDGVFRITDKKRIFFYSHKRFKELAAGRKTVQPVSLSRSTVSPIKVAS